MKQSTSSSVTGKKRKKADSKEREDTSSHQQYPPVPPLSSASSNISMSTTSHILQLYFRSRCDDVTAWQRLQELSATDPVAKGYVCDVLIHNESCQVVPKDIQLAQRLSSDVHQWIEAASANDDAATHAMKQYITGIFLAQGIGVPCNHERAAACIEEAAMLGYCLAEYYVGVWHRDGRRVPKNMEVSKLKQIPLAPAKHSQ